MIILKLLLIVLEKKEINLLGKKSIYRKLNPFNPISYILIILFIPIYLWAIGLTKTVKAIYDVFQWK